LSRTSCPDNQPILTDQEIQRLLEEPQEPLSHEVFLIVEEGFTIEQAREIVAERARLNARAERLINRPVEEWPDFEVKWDLDPRSFYRALDGARPSALDGRRLVVRWCVLRTLDDVLADQSRRGPDELWSLGDRLKLGRVLVHCSEGRALTPPWIRPIAGMVGIKGGHHRLAMCRAKGLKQVPVLVERNDLDQLLSILPLQARDKV
jgi:hypothetical protein